MKTEWNLEIFYKGIDDPSYEGDIAECQKLAGEFHDFIQKADTMPEKERVEGILCYTEKMSDIYTKLLSYLSLRQSVNTEDGEAVAQQARLMRMYSDSAADMAASEKILGRVKDVETLASQSQLIKDYKFNIKQAQKNLSHMLPDEVEAIISAMGQNGADAWSDLQQFLSSTVEVDYDGRKTNISEVRNLAYSDDPKVRKAAYEAELATYPKIEASVAFALHNIKNQFTTICEKRGYESPLAMTLEQSRMQKKTLDAMMDAIKEYLPKVRVYFKKKAELLGYKNGLPWYEMFAPVGKSGKTYTVEEAGQYLYDVFGKFSPEMADMMKEAFENEWIDFFPRKGKVGGAFCSDATFAKQSRILTNFDGTFGAVDTLAHELGHAFHNKMVENERIMLRDYPMPVAETASTFNEIHLCKYALKTAGEEEKLGLLDADLRETTQCVIDIYSRYLFETAVFERCRNQFLMAKDLNDLMIECQKQSYGDGLDPEYLNSGMWVCKSHYYIPSFSFYNFPYTFGTLFAEGLYSLFEEEGEKFVPKYKEMLRMTSVNTLEENGQMMGIDLTDKAFWERSLKLVCNEIDEYAKLVDETLNK